jgi:uncharacterized membrane protein YfcA
LDQSGALRTTDVTEFSPILIVAAGFVAGLLNAIAAGGSFIALPVLIALG